MAEVLFNGALLSNFTRSATLRWQLEVSHGGNIYLTDISKCYKPEPSLTPPPEEPVVNICLHNTPSAMSINYVLGTAII